MLSLRNPGQILALQVFVLTGFLVVRDTSMARLSETTEFIGKPWPLNPFS